MTADDHNKPTTWLVVVAFATVYIVWGSTYFFIQVAVQQIPPMMLGAMRFLIAGAVLMGWCLIRGEKTGSWKQIRPAILSGLMLLLMGTGAVIWAEKWLPSSLVAVLISSSPFWFVMFDVPSWKENLTNRAVILGLIFGFFGVTLMFGEKILLAMSSAGHVKEIIGIAIILIGTMSWAGGSLYAKYHVSGSPTVISAWQMIAAGTAFTIGSLVLGEWSGFHWQSVSTSSWLSLLYLIIMGSLAAYSAYVWLLKVRPAAQVSTYAYVNPLIAVLLGVIFAGEPMSPYQIIGLIVILGSVLMINLVKISKSRQ